MARPTKVKSIREESHRVATSRNECDCNVQGVLYWRTRDRLRRQSSSKLYVLTDYTQKECEEAGTRGDARERLRRVTDSDSKMVEKRSYEAE